MVSRCMASILNFGLWLVSVKERVTLEREEGEGGGRIISDDADDDEDRGNADTVETREGKAIEG